MKRLLLPVAACFIGTLAHAEKTKLTDQEIERCVARAQAVLADPDGINAAKHSSDVFEAAHALEDQGKGDAALLYYEKALQLSPWQLDDQLRYAALLMKARRTKVALEVARMVDTRSESDDLCNRARKLLGTDPVPSPPALDSKIAGPWVCLVKLGPVNSVVLNDSIRKLQDTLGIPVRVLADQGAVGKPNRSALSRWASREVIPKIRWDMPAAQAMLEKLGVKNAEDARPSLLIAELIERLRQDRLEDQARGLEEQATFFRKHDQQWDASVLVTTVKLMTDGTPNIANAIVVGITEADLFDGDNNYVFGIGKTGAWTGVDSYSRFRAEMFGEPPDRKRLVTRMHKLLLATTGFAIGVPRPTDPTTARSYSASLPEQDAKSEYMSEACIEGFESKLNIKLPASAHRPAESR